MSRDRANVRKVLQYRRERWRKGGSQVGALKRADLPLQLINGAAGPVVGTDTPGHWLRHVSRGALHELGSEVGHYPHLEAPGETLAAYCAFRQSDEPPYDSA